MARRTPIEWHKVRVWWSAKHRFTGTVHVAANYGKGGGKTTRCGIRMYRGGKRYKLYEWGKGKSPMVPTCSACLRLLKQDVEGEWLP